MNVKSGSGKKRQSKQSMENQTLFLINLYRLLGIPWARIGASVIRSGRSLSFLAGALMSTWENILDLILYIDVLGPKVGLVFTRLRYDKMRDFSGVWLCRRP